MDEIGSDFKAYLEGMLGVTLVKRNAGCYGVHNRARTWGSSLPQTGCTRNRPEVKEYVRGYRPLGRIIPGVVEVLVQSGLAESTLETLGQCMFVHSAAVVYNASWTNYTRIRVYFHNY